MDGGSVSARRLTIITPSYNHGPYLRRCIDSVLDQGWPNLQYLVLDGGSTDGTLEILQSYGDAIRWRTGADGGQASAINEGLRRADGDVVAWLNSDDYYLPGAFERVMATLHDAPEADMVFGHALMIDASERTMRGYPTFDFTRDHLRRKCYVCQPTVFLRRRVLADAGLLNDALDVCLDYDWWLRILRSHRAVFCPHVLAASRHYDTTKTASRRLRALVEAGYLMRAHFGRASWRWSAKWVAHRWSLRRGRFVVPIAGWAAALRSARRFRRRFDERVAPSRFGARLLDRLADPPRVAKPLLEVEPGIAAAFVDEGAEEPRIPTAEGRETSRRSRGA
jgi:glycosyltransferase involved in cell wall biosynthesis